MTLGVKRTEGADLMVVPVGVTSLPLALALPLPLPPLALALALTMEPESEGAEMMVVASVVDDKSEDSETADSVSSW
jgi:hypothetical protein